MMVAYKRNKRPAAYDDGATFVAMPMSSPAIPNGPFTKCTGCPYPRHGFLCWGKDGSCLRDDMKKIEQRGRKV